MQTITPDTMWVDIEAMDPDFQMLLNRMETLDMCARYEMEASIFSKLAQQATAKAVKLRHSAE